MPTHFHATAMADPQWLDLEAPFDLDNGVSNEANNGRKTNKDLEPIHMPLLQDGNRYDQLITLLDLVEVDSHAEEGSQGADSPPGMESGYDTSESGQSVAEELAAQYLTPLDTLVSDIDGRFGSYYSPTSETRPELQAWRDMNNAAYDDENERQSRFSWTSSIYSDDGLEEKAVWWKPIEPLVVKKDTEGPPPLPTRNPLRLLRRLSKNEPKGYSEQKRGSRNIHNLYLDLSRSNSRHARRSMKSPEPSRRKSHAVTKKKEELKEANRKPQLSLVIPGHISNAMRNSDEEARKAHRSARTSTSSKSYSVNHSARRESRECRTSTTTNTQNRSRSARDTPARSTTSTPSLSKPHDRSHAVRLTPISSGYAETLRSARSHVRGSSEPLHSSVSDVSSKWNASMPSHGTVRRSCIASLVNASNTTRRASQAASVNKRLPPLPMELKLQ
ncbi:hypothetical protein CC86DRAFT_367961 [Ophiobolus disseminans]|uniref:Uncharacterized protein n=1 Tax=Ophiobolus disseminans TaxID=1469910 RepID=A0A6A7ABN9_9PLEO|nr:hypothetical protein CC86DRAFT_367961 [Ophiobolus disseminans]